MIDKRKTLVILSPGFPQNEADTSCLPAQQSFVKSLKNNFPSLKIIVLSFQYHLPGTIYTWYDIEVIPVGGRDKTKLQSVWAWSFAWKKLKQLNRNNDIIGLFSFWCTECALLGKYFAGRNGLRHFIWILGKDAQKNNQYVRWLRPEAQDLVAISDFLAKEFHRNHLVKPQHIIPNGIDTAQYAAVPEERDIEILGAGSLIDLKQYEVFIEVVSELRKKLPLINTMICGEGPEKNNLQSLISKLQLEKNILLEGKKDRPELLWLMQRSRIFLNTSLHEGCSSLCLEALYAGASVISFFKPMAAWIKHWHIVNNKEEMVERILEILNDPDIDYRPVLPYSVSDSARAVMKLFDYDEKVV